MKKIILITLSLLLILTFVGCKSTVENTPVSESTEPEVSLGEVVTRAELGEENIIAERDNINADVKNDNYELKVRYHKLSEVTLPQEIKSKMLLENDKVLILDIIMDLKNVSKGDIDTSQQLAQITVNEGITERSMLSFLDRSESRILKPGEVREVAVSIMFDLENLPEIKNYILKFDKLETEIDI